MCVYLRGGQQTHAVATVGAPDIECCTCKEFGRSGEKRFITPLEISDKLCIYACIRLSPI